MFTKLSFGRSTGVLRDTIRLLSKDCNVGFVGIGNMGGYMALNLVKKGHSVILYDVNNERISQLKSEASDPSKVSSVTAPCELTKSSELEAIVTMLPASAQVQKVYNEMLPFTKPNTLFIDCTTGDPVIAKQISDLLTEKKANYIDAPVSGGVVAAKDGLLTFMVGGNKAQVSRADTLLSKMGKKTFHCGPDVGAGLAAKICNNLLLGISMIGTSEAMGLGKKLGLDEKVLAEVLNSSTGRCWSSELYNPVPGVVKGIPSSRNYEGGFGTALMAKDLGLAQSASTLLQLPTPLGSLAHQLYRLHSLDPNYTNKDFSSIYQILMRDK